MEENTQSFFPEKAENLNSSSGLQQEEIDFLNEDTSSNYIGDDQGMCITTPTQGNDFLEKYKSIEGIEILAQDEEIKCLFMQFEPESLQNLQLLSISISELIYSGTLLSLSSLIPVKVQIQPAGLAQPLVLLIHPQLTDSHFIHLKLMPYANYLPPIPLTLYQQEASKQAAPFFIIKRVVDSAQSSVFEQKQNELWDTLTLSVSIQNKLFKELMEVIKYQPLGIEKWVQNQFWTKEQSEKALKIIDSIFPLQLGLFTCLQIVFYPFERLHLFPHLQAIVQSKLLEQP
ncbi:hypothetical protein Q0590_00220 [Rhodocytophaga aerolata]|uniref:Uncharacterized protein n=1 Tax=Rhodocytophaga aerolata TaxID=455078 RepID=A0ABT8QXT4_9BACT|nr:hypothetical protein [Rhodocytophaga aerolata]MDO1444648.1 hypothetical protein [Rhodocytophaga aerolata]